MATTAARLRDPLVQADTPRRLGPLLRELGIRPALRRVPRREWDTFGLEGEEGLRGLVFAGERAGVLVLVAELEVEPCYRNVSRVARRLRARNPAVTCLLIAAGPRYRRVAFATTGIDGAVRFLVVDRENPGQADLELLDELRVREGEGGVEHALRMSRALDRGRIGDRFFREFRAVRAGVAAVWTGLPEGAKEEREQLALLLLSRLLFLYFLQREGHLAGETDYVPDRFRAWIRQPQRPGSFYLVGLEDRDSREGDVALTPAPPAVAAHAMIRALLPARPAGSRARHFPFRLPDRAVRRPEAVLSRRRCVLITDGVDLGKTHVGLALASSPAGARWWWSPQRALDVAQGVAGADGGAGHVQRPQARLLP